jgi:hypothetical protein
MNGQGQKGPKYLDYAVYGKVIVPLIHFDPNVWFQMEEDCEAGRCRFVSRRRRK